MGLNRWGQTWPAQQRRAAYVRPLFEYIAAHGVSMTWLLYRAAERRGYAMYRSKVFAIREGYCRMPPRFIADCCAVLERSPLEVMGAPWVTAHGDDVDVELGAEMCVAKGIVMRQYPAVTG